MLSLPKIISKSVLFKLEGVELFLGVMAGTVITVYTVDRPGNMMTINDAANAMVTLLLDCPACFSSQDLMDGLIQGLGARK